MSHTIIINGDSLPVIIRKHPRSRRMILRYQALTHHISLTLPRSTSIKQGLHFVEEKRDWIAHQILERKNHIPLQHGQVISMLGQNYTVYYQGGRGVVSIDKEHIIIPGDESFMKRRLLEWLKRQAKEEITRLALLKAEQIKKSIKKISLRDTRSRWGSCSYNGNLSFSWRLVFAPIEVLEYVVSHEVAHIQHHDHSLAFWKLVELLCPDYRKYRDWLKKHGAQLYSYK